MNSMAPFPQPFKTEGKESKFDPLEIKNIGPFIFIYALISHSIYFYNLYQYIEVKYYWLSIKMYFYFKSKEDDYIYSFIALFIIIQFIKSAIYYFLVGCTIKKIVFHFLSSFFLVDKLYGILYPR